MTAANFSPATQDIDMAVELEEGGKLAYGRLQSILPVRAKTRSQNITTCGTPGFLCLISPGRRQTAIFFYTPKAKLRWLSKLLPAPWLSSLVLKRARGGQQLQGYRRSPRTRHARPLYLDGARLRALRRACRCRQGPARGSASRTPARLPMSARASAPAPRVSVSQYAAFGL
jgi:hypothetical protein